MSGHDEDRDVLAGEFVLGTLDTAEMRSVAERARDDAALAEAIGVWQARLAPLARMVPPVAPPAAVWNRIADSAGVPRSGQTPGWRAFWDSLALWRWISAAGLAAAAVLLALVLVRSPVGPRSVTALLSTSGKAAAFLAEEMPGGGLRLRAVTPVAVASGKDLELWALAPGAKRPVALGVIPAVAQRLVVPHPGVRLVPHVRLLVSLEPKGGSPTGSPTGPVVFAGTLND